MNDNLKEMFGQEIIDALRPAGLGARVIRLQASPGCEPDGKFVADHLGGIAVL